ncbi:MAG: glutamine-hydrolyzing GMP synthase, partial [Bacilli bacterium]
MEKDYIIVLDYGSQYNQLIVRRIRELNVYSKLVDHEININELKNDPHLKGIILSGGPNSVYEEGAFDLDEAIFDLNIPILGICYGMQLITKKLGGEVTKGEVKEFGKTSIETSQSTLFKNTPSQQIVWMSHQDKVVSIPSSFTKVASSTNTEYVAFEDRNQNIYGIQFHPEVTHSEYGMDILKNFVYGICGLQGQWQMANIVDKLVLEIQEEVQDDKVLLALSGGVDSSVVAYLLEKAIGDKLSCVFVDHGLLRKDEAKQVVETFKQLNTNLIFRDEKELFLNKLKGVVDPEEKRKIIGNT